MSILNVLRMRSSTFPASGTGHSHHPERRLR